VGEYGKLLVQQGRSDDAAQFLRRAVELQPNDWSLYSALGVAYDQLNDQPNAKLAYERALTMKPGEPAILNNYAMSRMLAGDTAAARSLLAQAQASGSTDPKIARNLALLDSMTPTMATVPPNAAMAAAAPRPPVAHGTPAAINPGGREIVMQEIPIDPQAGPVHHRAHRDAKAARAARLARAHATQRLAAGAPKPPKTAKPAGHIPALRMTADASKP
jgi:tetratricopeptide (TPR) repeat protein